MIDLYLLRIRSLRLVGRNGDQHFRACKNEAHEKKAQRRFCIVCLHCVFVCVQHTRRDNAERANTCLADQIQTYGRRLCFVDGICVCVFFSSLCITFQAQYVCAVHSRTRCVGGPVHIASVFFCVYPEPEPILLVAARKRRTFLIDFITILGGANSSVAKLVHNSEHTTRTHFCEVHTAGEIEED